MTLSESEFNKIAECLDEDFGSKGPLTLQQRKRLEFMLADLDGTPVSYSETVHSLRDLAASGVEYRPKPGQILAAVREHRRSVDSGTARIDEQRSRFVREFNSACRIYGRRIAIELLDPHGEHSEWIPASALGHDAQVWGKARAQLVSLNVLGDQS